MTIETIWKSECGEFAVGYDTHRKRVWVGCYDTELYDNRIETYISKEDTEGMRKALLEAWKKLDCDEDDERNKQ